MYVQQKIRKTLDDRAIIMNRSTVYAATSVATGNRWKTCFLCDTRVGNSQIRNVDKIFHVEQKNNNGSNDGESLSATLSDILQLPVEEETAHSKILCKKCHGLCTDFKTMTKRLNELRHNLTKRYNETASKYNAKSIGVNLESDGHFHTVIETEDNIPSIYSIEEVNYDMAKVFENDTIVVSSISDNKSVNQNEIVLIKRETDSNSFFTISDIQNIEQSEDDSQDQTIHTVLLEQIGENTEFEQCRQDGSFAEANDQERDASEQYIITENLENSKEYFGASDDQMIEVNINGNVSESKTANYEYVFHEDTSGDVQNDIMEDENSGDLAISKTANEHKKRDLTDSYFKNDVMQNNIKSSRITKSGSSNDIQQKQMFVRNGMKFKCKLCDPLTEVIYDTKTISIHLKTDHNERVYVCSICGIDFLKRNPYNEHMDEHMAATTDGAYECEVCQTMFTDSRLFRIHKKTHSANMKIWSCKVCNKSYSSKNLLDEHMNMHTGDRPYKCPHCVKDFASKYTLTAHMKIHYDRKRPYECKDCGKSFFSNQNLTQHERTHTGIKEYECNVCHKKFGTPHNLDVHRIVHTGHKPFICRTCGKAFARRAEIKDHERTHTGERPYKCDLCKSSFAQRSNLMSHKRATHFDDKRYKCETCNRSFKRRRLLEYHTKATHTGERPYKCDVCNSTFVYPEHYKKHVRIHSGVKPFTCEVCGKAFNSRDNRNAHRYVHSDKKPYECSVCGLGFMRKPLLYAHMETQNHLNDTIIINQPHIDVKNERTESDTNQQSEENDDDIIYLMNDEVLMEDDDDEEDEDDVIFEEEHIVDDGEIINGEHLVVDGQFGNETNEDEALEGACYSRKHVTSRQKLAATQNDLDNTDGECANIDIPCIKRNEDVTFIEAPEVDPLNLEQICVPVDNDNISWIGLSS